MHSDPMKDVRDTDGCKGSQIQGVTHMERTLWLHERLKASSNRLRAPFCPSTIKTENWYKNPQDGIKTG